VKRQRGGSKTRMPRPLTLQEPPFRASLAKKAMSELNIIVHENGARDVRLPLDSAVEGFPPIANPLASFFKGALERVFSFPALLASALVGSVFFAARVFRVDPDLWWHIKVGEAILTTHRWPMTDPYSFTVTGQPWLAYEWLGDVLLAAVSRSGGVRGLEVLLIALGSAIVVGLYALATIRCGNSKAGFAACVLLSVLAGVSFSLRPQMLGYLFLVLALIALERFRQGRRGYIWVLPPLMVLWVNTHGSWIIGLMAIFTYWISGLAGFRVGDLQARCWSADERRHISFSFLLCLAALMATPYGTRVAASPFEFAFSLPLNVKYIEEWQPMAFNLVSGKLFLAVLLAVILAQVTLRLTWRLEELTLFLFGTSMACLHVRFLLVFVPFAAPILGVILARRMPAYDRAKDRFLLNAVLMACLIAAMCHYFPSRGNLEDKVAQHFPVGAVEYLQRHPVPGPMFNNYNFGGYLVWSRGPEQKVFIDGRGDVYERGGVLADYVHIADLKPGAFAVLRGYGIQSCLLKHDEALATVLSASPDWRRVYSDNLAAIFIRTRPWN
jgi:hypothetical protein